MIWVGLKEITKTELCLNRFATLAMKIGLENAPGQRQ